MNVTICNKSGPKKVIKYWRHCANCPHARFVIVRGIFGKKKITNWTMSIRVYLYNCPHIAIGKSKGVKHEKKPWNRTDIVPTSFTADNPNNREFNWQEFKGEFLPRYQIMQIAEIPPELWFDVFFLIKPRQINPCPACSKC